MLENKKKNKEMKSSKVFHPVSTFKMVRSKFLHAEIIYMFKMEKFLHTKTIYVKDGKIDHSLSKEIINKSVQYSQSVMIIESKQRVK